MAEHTRRRLGRRAALRMSRLQDYAGGARGRGRRNGSATGPDRPCSRAWNVLRTGWRLSPPRGAGAQDVAWVSRTFSARGAARESSPFDGISHRGTTRVDSPPGRSAAALAPAGIPSCRIATAIDASRRRVMACMLAAFPRRRPEDVLIRPSRINGETKRPLRRTVGPSIGTAGLSCRRLRRSSLVSRVSGSAFG
jgi:hypothetical protein